MRHFLLRVSVLGLFIAAIPIAGEASAAEADTETEALLQRGIQLRRSLDDAAALTTFLEAEKRSPRSVRVLLQIVAAAQGAGKWLVADAYLRKAHAYRSDPYYQRYEPSIARMGEVIAQRIARFLVEGSPEGAQVRLNGDLIGTLPMSEPKAVETGIYTLDVRRPGYFGLRRAIAIPGGGLTREVVELNELPNATAANLSGDVNAGAPEDRGTFWTSRWMTWTLAAAAAGAAVTSGVALVLREEHVARWNDDDRCLDATQLLRTRGEVCGGERESMDTYQGMAIAGAAAAGAFGIGAVAHYLLTRDGERREHVRDRGRHTAGCDLGLLTLACQAAF